MALNPSTSSANVNHAAGQASAHAAMHAASTARAGVKPRAEDDESGAGGSFAAQLLKAAPDPEPDASSAMATHDAKADAKPSDGARDGRGDDDPDDGHDDKDESSNKATAPDPAAQAVDPAALMSWSMTTTSTVALAARPGADAGDSAAGADALGSLRRGKTGRPGKDDSDPLADLLAGADKAAASAATLGAALGGAPGAPGATAAAELTAALDKAAGRLAGAADARSDFAALLPQPDPATVQAGAIGASPNALLDNSAATPPPALPAQATLPMTPQNPAFGPALGQQIEVWMRDGVQHAEVQLSPRDLGPITVRIAIEGTQTRVEMSADVASTRNALQQALPQLSESLGQVGLSLSGGGVSDQSTAQSQQSRADADARAAAGGTGRAGSPDRGGAGGDGDDFAAVSAARQAVQRRGLLDLYA